MDEDASARSTPVQRQSQSADPESPDRADSETSTASKCRICWISSEYITDLIDVCYCKGSIGKVHVKCLERWLQQSSTEHCDLCFYRYNVKKSLKYGVRQSVRPFFRDSSNRRYCRQLLSTLPGITFLVAIASTCCLLAVFALDDREPEMVDFSYMLFKTVLIFSLALILVIYSVMLYCLILNLIILWREWRSSQVEIRLVLPEGSHEKRQPRTKVNHQGHAMDDEEETRICSTDL